MSRRKRREASQEPSPAAELPAWLKRPELGLFLLALALRILHLWLYRGDFWAWTPLLDDNIFVSWRDVIAREGFLARSLGVFNLNPGYPYVLAALARVFGHGLFAPVLLQHVLGALVPPLLFRVGRELFDERVGLLAGLLAVVYGPAVFYESRLLGESFIYLLNAGFLFLLCRGAAEAPEFRSALAGILLGLSAVFRPTALALAPLAALWILATTRVRGSVRSWLCVLLFALGVWLPMLPVQLRNRVVDPASGWGLTTASGGVNLFLGNNPEADGLNKAPSFVRYGPGQQYQDFKEEAERRAGRTLSAREVSAFWTGRVREWFRVRPDLAWGLVLRKAALFWNRREPPDNFFPSLFERFTKLGAVPLVGWGLVAPLGLWGLLASLGWLSGRWLLHGYALAYFGLVTGFYVLSRYRFPAAAALIPLAAFGLVRLRDLLAQRRLARAFAMALLLLPCVLLSRLPLIGEEDAASSHYSMGVIYANQGWKEKAVEEYRASLAADPGFSSSWLNLGLLLNELGRGPEAAAALENAARTEADPARRARIASAAAGLRGGSKR